jgi:protein arginine kinase
VIFLDDLANRCPEWLRGSGPESDIVMSSRIRLARNLADFPFIRRCTDIDRANIELTIRERLTQAPQFQGATFVKIADLESIDRQFLVERQLISREHAEGEGARTVAVDSKDSYSVMINEEDHLRIQVMKSGFDLDAAWERANGLDDAIESMLNVAYHRRYGYLTACPTNVGTGLRVSVMVHLPALVITQQIEKLFRSLQKISLAVRGLYGEGSQAMGDFYQVSNQITLGKSEAELLKQVGDIVPIMINYERKAREYLLSQSQTDLFDKVRRAYGLLQNAQQISSEETLHLLSTVRMGINMGLITEVDIPTVTKLFVHTQPSHLQKLRGAQLDTTRRNIERANYLQSYLCLPKNRSSDKN